MNIALIAGGAFILAMALAIAVAYFQCGKEHCLHDGFWVLVILLLPCIGVILYGIYEKDHAEAPAY